MLTACCTKRLKVSTHDVIIVVFINVTGLASDSI
jgi:hypothetical protein